MVDVSCKRKLPQKGIYIAVALNKLMVKSLKSGLKGAKLRRYFIEFFLATYKVTLKLKETRK